MIKTGLFSGSFNPVHNGHLAIAQSFISSGKIDELWVYPTPVSPFKTGKEREELLPYKERLSLLTLAFDQLDHPKIDVKSVEKELSPPYYTVNTLRHLRKTNPDRAFYLCIGSDSANQFHRWHKYIEILKIAELLVAKRPDNDSEDSPAEDVLEHTTFINHKPIDISSTKIRNWLKNKEYKKAKSVIPDSVFDELISRNVFG